MINLNLPVVNWTKVFFSLWLVALTACSSKSETGRLVQGATIPSLSYSSSGGCANVFLWAGSDDQMEWLTVLADRRRLGFSAGPTTYDVAADTLALHLRVELFAKPGFPEYCSDARLEPHIPTAVWTARSGRLTITLIGADVGFKGGGMDSYTARVRLDSCTFTCGDGRTTQQAAPIEMEAKVGWMAG
jgi:hypothetical protein